MIRRLKVANHISPHWTRYSSKLGNSRPVYHQVRKKPTLLRVIYLLKSDGAHHRACFEDYCFLMLEIIELVNPPEGKFPLSIVLSTVSRLEGLAYSICVGVHNLTDLGKLDIFRTNF